MRFINRDIPLVSIPKGKSSEYVTKSGHSRYHRMRLYPLGQKVGTTYIPSRPFRAMFFKDILVSLKNPHETVALEYYIRGCLDPRIWHEVVGSEATPSSIAVGAVAIHSTSGKGTGGVPDIEKGFAWLQVMVKVAAGSGQVEGYIAGLK